MAMARKSHHQDAVKIFQHNFDVTVTEIFFKGLVINYWGGGLTCFQFRTLKKTLAP